MFLSVFTQYRTFLLSFSLLLSTFVCTGYAGDSAFPLRRVQQTELVVTLNHTYPDAVAPPTIGASFSGYFRPFAVRAGAPWHRCRLEHALLAKAVLRRSLGSLASCYMLRLRQPLKTIPTNSDEIPIQA